VIVSRAILIAFECITDLGCGIVRFSSLISIDLEHLKIAHPNSRDRSGSGTLKVAQVASLTTVCGRGIADAVGVSNAFKIFPEMKQYFAVPLVSEAFC
jgi:hypothetical protein